MGCSRSLAFIIISLAFSVSTVFSNCIKSEENIFKHLSTGSDANEAPFFSYIYYDDANEEMYLGSSDYIYKVDPSDFTVVWAVKIPTVKITQAGWLSCETITNPNDLPFVCKNQISLIEKMNDTTWFVCGTNSLSPACWRCVIAESSTEPWTCQIAGDIVTAEQFVPKEQKLGSTWYYDRDQIPSYVFAGTQVASHDQPYFSKYDDELFTAVDQTSNDESWLNLPAFVGKPIKKGRYIYFFFRETAIEYKNAGKIIYSRVGRVCANNTANKDSSFNGKFQTFVKARLNCSIDLRFPFYFNEIQDTYEENDIVYAVFTTPSEGPPASAVCAYSMKEIEQLFNSLALYKGQEVTDAEWTPKTYQQLAGVNARLGECDEQYTNTPGSRNALKNYNLIDQLVPNLRNVRQPNLGQGVKLRISDSPLLYYNDYRFRSIVKADEYKDGPIVFMIGTDNMRILKTAYDPTQREYGTIISEIVLNGTLNDSRSNDVRDMVLYSNNHTFVIATAVSHAFKVAVQFCDSYKTCEECLLVKDPHCTWGWMNSTCNVKGCHYDGTLQSTHPSTDTCAVSSESEGIDYVKDFGGAQRASNTSHVINYYSLMVAKKGSNIEVISNDESINSICDVKMDTGTTSETEYQSIRVTCSNSSSLFQSVTFTVSKAGVATGMIELKVINDTSAVAEKKQAEKIFDYDCQLASYEFNMTTIRQDILESCDCSTNIHQCPSFRFQGDRDSYTCPA